MSVLNYAAWVQYATETERFWSRVSFGHGPDACWTWYGTISSKGYGTFRSTVVGVVHRFAYELLVGEIPRGLEIDHLCRNRACVNPAHMEPVTGYVNIMRGMGPPAKNAVKVFCKHGHRFTPENTYVTPSTGQRSCRKCTARNNKRWQRANPDKIRAYRSKYEAKR